MNKIYWNSQRKCWFMLDAKTGRLLRHAYTLALQNCRFQVSAAGRHRMLQTGRKNVHAFILGEEINVNKVPETGLQSFQYRPEVCGAFQTGHEAAPVFGAGIVLLRIEEQHPVCMGLHLIVERPASPAGRKVGGNDRPARIQLDPADLKLLDAHRGELSRAAWVRRVLRAYCQSAGEE